MYGTAFQSEASLEAQQELSQITIGNIPNREGQYLRNALIDRFYRDGYPSQSRYTLNVGNINENIIDLDITKSADATRGQIKLSTQMTLTDLQSGEVVLTRPLRAIGSFNILTSEFATRVTEENARKNALDNLAQQIEQQIVLFLKR